MENFIKTATDILTPVIESSIVLGGHYMKACNRSILTSKDMEYALKYCAINVTGTLSGPMFDQDDSDDEDIEEVDEAEEPFTRYVGSDKLFNNVNDCYDSWDRWEPHSPIERVIKSSIDQMDPRSIF